MEKGIRDMTKLTKDKIVHIDDKEIVKPYKPEKGTTTNMKSVKNPSKLEVVAMKWKNHEKEKTILLFNLQHGA